MRLIQRQRTTLLSFCCVVVEQLNVIRIYLEKNVQGDVNEAGAMMRSFVAFNNTLNLRIKLIR